MKVFPAIDIRGGRVVSLEQGDFDRQQIYSDNPVEIANSFKESGAKYLHMVDLDGAKEGSLVNLDIVANIIKETGLKVQIGGGIRDRSRIESYLEVGVLRVIIGSVAAQNPDFAKKAIEDYKEKVAIAVDAKNDKVAVHAWDKYLDLSAIEFCEKLDSWGADTIIFTDIARDGMLAGSNVKAYKELVETCSVSKIIASGGVTTMEEILQLRGFGVDGVILGKAIYTDKLSLREVVNNVG